jgi:hypothetical protein
MTWTRAVVLACLAVVVTASGAWAQPTGCTPVSPGVVDGTFEAGEPWPAWTTQTSTNFGTPICEIHACGTGGGAAPPFAGSNWAFFGGVSAAENATIGQTVTIPNGLFLFLRFQMRIGAVSSPFTDTLVVNVDATPVATFTEPATPEAAYSARYVNVTAFANNGPHAITFAYTHPGAPSSVADFAVDDVELLTCATPVELMDFKVQ